MVTAVGTTTMALLLSSASVASTSPAGLVTFVPEDVNDAPAAQVATSWGTLPSGGANLRRTILPKTIGGTIVWKWESGLEIPVTGNSLIIRNAASATPGTIAIAMTIEAE